MTRFWRFFHLNSPLLLLRSPRSLGAAMAALSVASLIGCGEPPAGAVLGDPLVFRAAPAASSPLRPVAGFQFRRTERAVVEWPLLKDAEKLEARLLGRDGQPLALPVQVGVREGTGGRVAFVDLNLAPLGAGEYVLDLSTGSGESERRLVALLVAR